MSGFVGIPRVGKNRSGFTILETILFLAISGGMLFIALSAISGRSDEVRFQQSMGAIEAFMQLQQNYVQNGVLTASPKASCAGSDCILLGRAIEFQADSSDLIVHTIIGSRTVLATGEPAQSLGEAAPDASLVIVETNTVEWQATFETAEFYTGDVTKAEKVPENRVIAYVRTPNGTEILPIGFRVGAAESAVDYLSEPCLYDAAQACNNASFVPGDDTVPGDSTAVSSFSAELCFASARGNDYAKLILGGAGQQRAIELDLQGGVSCA